MYFIKEQVRTGRFMAGAWCNLASGITTEMAARSGYDWILIDQEHGPGDNLPLLQQIQAIGDRPSAPIVRIAWNERVGFKRALDLGASGIMIPYIETAEDAARTVAYLRYPPQISANNAGTIMANPRPTDSISGVYFLWVNPKV